MKITETIDYAAAPAAVFAMLTDPAFQEAKCIEAGSERHESAVTSVGDGARVVTQRELPADDLPDFARSIVGDRLAVTVTYEWGGAAATSTTSVPSRPSRSARRCGWHRRPVARR